MWDLQSWRRRAAFEGLRQDVRSAVRALGRRPASTAAAVAVLSAGFAVTIVCLCLAEALILRPLPQHDPVGLVTPVATDPARGVARGLVSMPQFLEWSRETAVFERLALLQWNQFDLVAGSEGERVGGAWVSVDYFRTLEARSLRGRLIDVGDFDPQAPKVVVLSQSLWRRRFAEDPAIVGRVLSVDGTPHTVIGIAASEALWPSGLDAWIPLAISPFMMRQLQRFDAALFESIGRLRPGVTVEQAGARLEAVSARQARDHPELSPTSRAAVLPLRDRVVEPSRRAAVALLLGAVGFVLVLCCGNLAVLLIARAHERRPAVAVRLAIGATPLRAVREAMVETLLVVLGAAAAGIVVAAWLLPVVSAGANSGSAADLQLELSAWAVVVTCLVMASVAAGLVVFSTGMLLRGRPLDGLHGQATSMRTARGKTGQVLVASEVALSVVLLLGAGLMIRSAVRVQQIDPGFDDELLLELRLRTPPGGPPAAQDPAGFPERVREALGSLPDISSVAMASSLPAGAGGMYFERPVLPDGLPDPPASRDVSAQWTIVTPQYFETLGVRVLKGRAFDDRDERSARPVVIVNQALATALFPGERRVVGRKIRAWRDKGDPLEVVGVVADVRCLRWLDDTRPIAYVPHRQSGVAIRMVAARLRPGAEWRGVLNGARRRLAAMDAHVAVLDAGPMSQVRERQRADSSAITLALTTFSAFGCAIACVGIYAVGCWAVGSRRREFGVRMTLGAAPLTIVAMVTRQAVVPVMLGLFVGVVLASGLTTLLRGALFQIEPTDLATYIVVPLLFAGVTLGACLVPAARAAAIDPVDALRHE